MYDCPQKNPNLFVTLSASGGLWFANVLPWQELYPWTFNAPA